tara:strand:- start:473 stop:1360 length:888 start_codon:yes stop_codon:yes gene_type:complete
MPTIEILKKLTLPALKAEVRKTNMKNWSSLRKPALIELMLKPEHIQRFHHLGTTDSKKKYIIPSRRTVAEPPKKKLIIRNKITVDKMTTEAPKKKVKLILRDIKGVAKKIAAKTPSQATVIAPKKREPMKAKATKRINPVAKDAAAKGAEKNRARIQKEVKEIEDSKKPKQKAPKVFTIKSITFEDVIDNKYMYETIDEAANYWQSMMLDRDFTDVLTAKQSRWYVKNYGENLSEKDDEIRENIEQKIMMNTDNILAKQRGKIFREWKKDNKGMKGSADDFDRSFGKYYDSKMGN